MTPQVRDRVRLSGWLPWCGVAVLVALTSVLAFWRLDGGTWVRVETPSMGTVAPVGTLLWVKPVAFESLRPGDLVTFRPPGSVGPRGITYSHEIRAINPDGTLSTQGRISAPDPWRISPEQVVGKTVLRMPGAGWLVLAAPILLLGGGLVLSVCTRLRDRELRLPVAVVGGALVIVAALVVHRPLTGAEQMAFVPDGDQARATYVATGLLPVRISAPGGESVVLRDGQVGAVVAPATDPDRSARRFTVSIGPAVPTTWWVVLVGLCFVPALTSSLRRRRSFPVPAHPVPV